MYIILYTITIIIFVSAIRASIVKDADLKQDDYVSEESDELPEINEVIDSVSKEYYDSNKNEIQGDTNNITVTQLRVDLLNTSVTASPLKINSATLKSFDCESKVTSNSEESLCKSTLVNYPYSASIQKKGAHYASGVLINGQSILTAAGVFYNIRETIKLFRVRLGSVDCKSGGDVLPIQRVEIHPSYQYKKPAFDLALVKLARPLEFTDYIKPIPLSMVKQGVMSAKFLTTYWPRLIVDGKVVPKSAKERVKQNSMRVSTQTLIPWKTCAVMMKARETTLDENSLCLKPIATHHSICMPDVGAPVIAEDGLWGITSGWTSKHCTTYPSPTVVTRIATPSVRDWLKSVL